MMVHMQDWIDAALDGELDSARQQALDDHLAGCAECRNRLHERQMLSSLLAELPPAPNIKSAAQFAALFIQDLPPRRSSHPIIGRSLRLTWQLIPLGLLAAFAFIESTAVLSGLVWVIPGADALLLQQASALTWLAVPYPFADLLNLFGVFTTLDWDWIAQWSALAIVALAYIGWLAAWLLRSGKIYLNQ